eukprot:403349068
MQRNFSEKNETYFLVIIIYCLLAFRYLINIKGLSWPKHFSNEYCSCEFFGNQTLVLSFKHAMLSGINQGICGAMVSTNTVYVLLFSFLIFHEKISPIQLAGVCLMVVSVGIVSLFKTNHEEFKGMQQELSIEGNGVHEDQTNHLFITIMGGLFSSVMFGSQILLFKFLLRYTKEVFSVAFAFLLFASMYGVGSMMHIIGYSKNIFQEHTLVQYICTIFTGITLSSAIILQNVTCNYGQVGISNAIMNCQVIIVTLFNFLVQGQPLNLAQGFGIVLSVIGGILISTASRLKVGH